VEEIVAEARTYQGPGVVLTEHEFAVPLDHAEPGSPEIVVFAREIADPEGRDRPLLVFFEGGPGLEPGRPTGRPPGPPWLPRALRDYRVLFLDQRGTGRSTPVGPLAGMTPAEQAAYLTHFRADSIVRDAESIRRELEVERWSVIGQSFGGFCVTAYLSIAPGGLREAFTVGGLPPVGRHVDDVYRHTYPRVLERNKRYYARYPEDRARVLEIHRRIAEDGITLPSGDVLTSRRFRQLGLELGMSDGAERLHSIVELPPDSPAFLHDVESMLPFARNPIFAILHESCYADGCVTGWSAERLQPDEYETPELFTGEHVFSWMFEDYGALRPLREAAQLVAEHPWPKLYDAEQLARNEVPAASLVYANDMYVERALSEETAAGVRGLHVWLTNEYEHNGLHVDGERILDRLFGLVRGAEG
jgi:pimeloyl-ACP methyl ester carboxylesterase